MNIPHSRHLLPNKNHPGIFFFFFPLGMLFMLFLTAPEVWTPGNTQIIGVSLRTKCLQNIKRRDLSTPPSEGFYWEFWFSSRNIQEHSFHDGSVVMPKFHPKIPIFQKQMMQFKKKAQRYGNDQVSSKNPLLLFLRISPLEIWEFSSRKGTDLMFGEEPK